MESCGLSRCCALADRCIPAPYPPACKDLIAVSQIYICTCRILSAPPLRAKTLQMFLLQVHTSFMF